MQDSKSWIMQDFVLHASPCATTSSHSSQSACNPPQCTFFFLLSVTSSHAHHEHLARLKSPAASTVLKYHLLLPCPLSAFIVLQYLPTSSDDSAFATFTSSHFRRPSCTSLMWTRGFWLQVRSCNASRGSSSDGKNERINETTDQAREVLASGFVLVQLR
jgi:hypothetical protein